MKKLFQKIFSISDSTNNFRKVVTILGIKFTVKIRRKMKLGVSYNLFDGEELLEDSIKQIRKHVDYINVIYQKKSYYKQDIEIDIEKFLDNLIQKGLVDEIFLYDKDFDVQDKHIYEKEKRDIGLKLAQKAGCTHYLNMDVDEFYDEKEFKFAKEYILANDIEMSAVSIYEYLKSPEYRFVDSYTFTQGYDKYSFYVPFIVKINLKYSYSNPTNYPCLADPSRQYNNQGKFYLFSLQDIVMHHMSTVRKNLHKKYENSNLNLGDETIRKNVYKTQEDILSWAFEDNQIGNSEYSLFQNKLIKKVDNKFNINVAGEN